MLPYTLALRFYAVSCKEGPNCSLFFANINYNIFSVFLGGHKQNEPNGFKLYV